MKRIIESKENELEDLLGCKVLFLCGNYFYHGTLAGVNDVRVELSDASIVYETGSWDAAVNGFKDAQKLPGDKLSVRLQWVEAYLQIGK